MAYPEDPILKKGKKATIHILPPKAHWPNHTMKYLLNIYLADKSGKYIYIIHDNNGALIGIANAPTLRHTK